MSGGTEQMEMGSPPDSERIFLCHTSADKDFVRKLASDLWDLDVNPWLDEWEIEPGDSLHEQIGNALERCSFVGVILSPDSRDSVWVKKEMRQALSREDRSGDKVIIPLMCRKVQPPPFLEDKLYLDFDSDYWRALGQLIVLLHKLDQQQFARSYANNEVKTMPALKEVLKVTGWQSKSFVNRALFRRLREFYSLGGSKRLNPDRWEIRPRWDRDFPGGPHGPVSC